MRRASVGMLAVVVMLAGAGCGKGVSRSTRTGAIRWTKCGRIQCATLPVPLDHADPKGRVIDLALARRPADGARIGALLTNPGGPGASGISLVEDASSVFPRAVLDRFDIISWDPRGVGKSAPIRCVSNLDSFYAVDRTPDDAAELQANVDAAQRLADACERESGDLLPFVSTRRTVVDLERIRVALGERRLTYVGFSYGSYIGSLYAERYPNRIRAMVLDGAIDPSVGFAEAAMTQAAGFDGALDEFFDYCRSPSQCDFGGDDPAASYDALLDGIDVEPQPGEVGGEERTLGPGEADIGVATALYAGRSGWETLSQVLDQAARGDGSGLLQLSDAYTSRQPGGEYGNDTEAFYAIGCLDSPAPASVEEVAALARATEQRAPRLGGATVWLGLPCTFWPVAPDGDVGPVAAPTAPPIVVLGTTGDPATPLSWAESLALQLTSARLVVLESEGHTAYGRTNTCVDRAVNRYLIELVAPKDGTRCR